MNTLFYPAVEPADVPPIFGLRSLPDYVSRAEERGLVEAIDGLPWNTEWKRRRQPYGAGYGVRRIRPLSPSGAGGWPTACSPTASPTGRSITCW